MVAILVIATFISLLAVDYIMHRSASKRKAAVQEPLRVDDRFLIPRGFFFGPKHSWIEILWNGKARVGIDDFSQKIIGTVDSVAVLPRNSAIRKGQSILTVVQGNRKLSFASPISGRIVDINEKVMSSPAILNRDPYLEGWIAVLEPENLNKEIKGLTIAEEAAQWLKMEVSQFREFIKARSPQMAVVSETMLDGGVPVVGALRSAAESDWKAFEDEFLKPMSSE